MLQSLWKAGWRRVQLWAESLRAAPPAPFETPEPSRVVYQSIQRFTVRDGVCQTLFDDFAQHRRTQRGDEEIGWVLLGRREARAIHVLATLPAGAQRESSVTHVRFNAAAQAVASRILRQQDKSLGIVGIVHTHPGSLRHPSTGDFQGDSQWVTRLRGQEGVFAIGTADAQGASGQLVAAQPHRQILGSLAFSWYALAHGDLRYRKMPLELTLGDDLAKPLHPVWPVLERHAESLDRVMQLLSRVQAEPTRHESRAGLLLRIPLPGDGSALKVLLEGDQMRYYVESPRGLTALDPPVGPLDRSMFLILAELANA